MASPADRSPLLTLGRVDRIRLQVGYRTGPDGPAWEQFLLDLPVPEDGPQDGFDERPLLAALEPALYVGAAAPRHYSLHLHRWRTSWGASPGVVEIGLLVTAGPRTAALLSGVDDGVNRAFHELLSTWGHDGHAPTSRDEAILRARDGAAAAYAVAPAALSVSAEEHHGAANSWTVGLRTNSGDEYDVVVGVVDGYAGSVRVRHEERVEVSDSVGSA